jgi:uncharacterized protein (DUF934 family)
MLEKMRMREIIKNKQVISDDWITLHLPPVTSASSDSAESTSETSAETAETIVVPSGRVLIPLTVWQAQRAQLVDRAELGIWLASDERPEALKDDLNLFKVIAVNFPKFTDGRGYSIAFNLRTRLGYQGELRAIGDVLRDQLFYMHRVGFNAFATREDRNIHDALKGLTDFSESYQTSWDQKTPLFKRVERPTAQV